MAIHQSFSDASTWEERRKRLQTTIDAYASYLQLLPTFPRRDTLICLSIGLKGYFSNCFSLFDRSSGSAQPWQKDHILSRILEQASLDLAAIQLAVAQRHLSGDDGNENGSIDSGNESALEILDRADKLAYAALEPAFPGMKFKDEADNVPLTVVTYLNRLPFVRILPYAPVALIGLPFTTSSDSPVDYLSIPHEVGHFVFRYHPFSERLSPTSRGETKARLPTLPTSADNQAKHTAEIFADVYGALVAGPILAESSQIVHARHDQSQFTDEDNETHPAPFVRPHIYTSVLQQAIEEYPGEFTARDGLSKSIKEIKDDWIQYRDQVRRVEKASRKGRFLDGMIEEIYKELFPGIQTGWNEHPRNAWGAYRKDGYQERIANSHSATGVNQAQTKVYQGLKDAFSKLKEDAETVNVPDLALSEAGTCSELDPDPFSEEIETADSRSYADLVEEYFPHEWDSWGGNAWHT